jgi:hypothetical protein
MARRGRPTRNRELWVVDSASGDAHRILTLHSPKALDWKYIFRAIREIANGYPSQAVFATVVRRKGAREVSQAWYWSYEDHKWSFRGGTNTTVKDFATHLLASPAKLG